MRYIITGVDGQLSSRIAENMLNEVDGKNLTFTCYKINNLHKDKRERWKSLGVKVVEANYDDIDSLERAFEGGDRIYIVSGLQVGKRQQQHKNAIDAAIKMGVKHIIYNSCIGATEPEYSRVYITPDHTATEKYLKSLDISYNTMRNNLYLENYLTMYPMLAFMLKNEWYSTAGEGRATFVHKDDVARVGAALLLGKGEDNISYNVCGSESISVREICEIVSKAAGIDLKYFPASDKEYYEYLSRVNIPELIIGDFSKSPVPFCGADIVTNDEAVRDGLLDVKSDAVEKLTGLKPKTAKEIVWEYSYMWEENVTNWKDMR
ncbi:NmrA family NAD(P)-binding protein [Clostridium estertheticum]|uniref:NmrA family NAD(P)-binding protein n=1 Tax=Clostridium estertheticum TaxID=238834 RepID=UPI001CF19220|nr:NmrA family NAD(P)-binding protein [Clostridium estertheticum]MCB2362338.1 NmrA family NAD(P)-binding protein [Clostridium estertheticum]